MARGFIDRYNAVMGAVVTVLTAVFGVYWYIFAGYLLCNVLDWLTGWYKSRKLGQESSKKRTKRDPEKGRLLGDHPGGLFNSGIIHSLGRGSSGHQPGIPGAAGMVYTGHVAGE